MGILLQNIGAETSSLKIYQQALKIKPDYADAHFNVGILLQNQAKFHDAIKAYKTALSIDQNLTAVHNNLGITYQNLGDTEAAEKSFHQALEADPRNFEVLNNLGIISQDKGEFLKAIGYFKQALEIEPKFEIAWCNIRYPLFVIKSQGVSEVEILEKLPKINDESTKLYISILLYFLFQNDEQAGSLFEACINLLSHGARIENTKKKQLKKFDDVNEPLAKNLIALVHFGRSGTGFFHSLIDGHPEITTLPSIYFSSFLRKIGTYKGVGIKSQTTLLKI